MHSHVWRARVVGLLVGVAALAGCADTGTRTEEPPAEPQAASPPPATTVPGAADTSDEGPPTEESDADVEVIEVAIVDGQARTDHRRVDVAVGTIVRIQVRADVEEEIHVHGYDLTAPVSAADPGTLEFTADIPGVFEVEAEHSGLELFRLRVR